MFWSIRGASASDRGWVREMYRGAPIVTASADEAFRWDSRRAADEAAAMIAALGDRIPVVVVRSPPGLQQIWGAPSNWRSASGGEGSPPVQ